jgi:hypothetical protein
MTTQSCQPVCEPLRRTLLRTLLIAMVIAVVLSRPWVGDVGGGLTRWLAATLLALWPAFGGHYVELAYLNGLRPRLPASRAVQIAARLATWFVGGAVLTIGMLLTARLLSTVMTGGWLTHHPVWKTIVAGGIAFIAIELIVHVILQLRGAPNFFNGRG